jgi:hypothetical protein
MPKFRVLPILMALGVTFNHFHCIGTSVKAAAVVIEQVRRAEIDDAARDMGSIPKCENETGCICQGAIFIAPAPYDLIDLSACDWNADFEAVVLESPMPTCLKDAAIQRRHFAPPISSRALRAWISSFLI